MTNILDTQHRFQTLERQRRTLESKLANVLSRIERAKQAHRTQIAASLQSKNPDEREMAERIATWWDVPLPSSSQSPDA